LPQVIEEGEIEVILGRAKLIANLAELRLVTFFSRFLTKRVCVLAVD
jgi:hypothetical protein